MMYVILGLCSLFLTYIIKEIALKKSILAMPNERSSHTVPTPHGGGIAIALSWFVGLVYIFTCKEIEANLFYALMAGVVLSIVSYIDDVYELSPKLRILTQVMVSALGLYLLGGLLRIDLGFFVIENPIITNALALFGMVWFINLYNFLDGIDGYAGSEAVFLGLAGFVLFGAEHYLLLVMCVLGFLVWNWSPAKIFMGDVGSTLLGYTVAVFALYEQNEGTSVLVWLILFGLFWFDATLTLYRRYKNGEKLAHAHRKHAYQRLVQSGWGHKKVVLYGLGINIFLAMFGYISFHFKELSLFVFLATLVFLWGSLKFIDNRKKFE